MRQSSKVPAHTAKRPVALGRADVLIILGALLATGLVAAGVVLVLFGDSSRTPGIVPVGQQQDRSMSEVATVPSEDGEVKGDMTRRSEPTSSRKSDKQLNRYATEGSSSSDEYAAKQRAIAAELAESRGLTDEQATLARKYPDRGAAARSADELEKERRAAKAGYAERAATQSAGTRTRTARSGNQPATATATGARPVRSAGKGAVYGNGANGGNGVNGGSDNSPVMGQSGGNRAATDRSTADSVYTGVEKVIDNGPGSPGTAAVPETGVYQEQVGEIVDEEDLIQYYDPPVEEEVAPEEPVEPEQPEVQLDGGAAYLQIPESVSVGSTVQLPLMIDTGGRYLAAYGLELAWDNTILSVDSVDAGDGAFDPPFVINLENDKGQLRFNGISITPRAAGLVNVATLTVTVHNRPSSGVATIRPLSGNQTVAVYADDGTTPLTIPTAAFVTAQLRMQ